MNCGDLLQSDMSHNGQSAISVREAPLPNIDLTYNLYLEARRMVANNLDTYEGNTANASYGSLLPNHISSSRERHFYNNSEETMPIGSHMNSENRSFYSENPFNNVSNT